MYHKKGFPTNEMANNFKNSILDLGYASEAFIEKEDNYTVYYKTDY